LSPLSNWLLEHTGLTHSLLSFALSVPAPKTKRLPVATRAAHYVSTKKQAPEFVAPVEFRFIQ
jgi:hypothetical protein